MDTLSIVGSIASIVGGLFSWWQYSRANTAAEEAKKAKDSILNRQQIGELEKALISAHDAENILIGRSSKRMTNQGKSLSTEYTKIQKFISDLNEIYETFTTAEHTNPLEHAQKHLTKSIKDYNEENIDIQSLAQELLEDVRSVIAVLKRVKSQKEFK